MLKIIYVRLLNLKSNYIPYLIFLALPLVFMFVFGSAMGSGDGKILLPVHDSDKSEYSLALVRELESVGTYNIAIMDMEELKRQVSENSAEVGLVIPEGFRKSILDGETPGLEMFITRESPGLYSLEGVLLGSIQRINYNISIADGTVDFLEKHLELDAEGRASLKERVYQLTGEKWKERLPVAVSGSVVNRGSGVSYDMYTQTSIGFTIAFSMFTFIFAVGEILEEKQNRVWDRINVSPLSRFRIYSGNLVFACTLGMAQMFIMVLIGYGVLGVNWLNNIPGLIMVLLAYTFCTVSLGLLMSSVVRTSHQLQVIAPVLLVSSSMIGGCYWPLEIVESKLLLAASKVVPQGWAMNALKDIIIYNQGMGAVYLPSAVLMMMGVLFMGTALQVSESAH